MNLAHSLQHLRSLDDDNLLRSLKRHVGSSNRLNALVLAHLAEVDARSAYRQWACDTLAAYCVYELRLSEDEAQRRCRAARIARQFPVLFDMLAGASIHLTGIFLAPYLTEENHRELLARARFRRKREIERLVAEFAPAREVPALVEPLGCAAERSARASSSWAALVEGQAGWVRELQPGDRSAEAPSAHDDWHEELIATLERDVGDADARAADGSGQPPAPLAAPAGNTPAAPARTAGHGVASMPPSTTAPRPPKSSRHVPAAVRRAVWHRDGGRCTFYDPRGVRCRATAALEFHHEQPFARGGAASAENITLRCRAHNELAAERDFGRDFVQAMNDPLFCAL